VRIQDFDNGDGFQKFVKAVFAAEYGGDFQAIDDSAGDGGNDGYVGSKRTLLAIFCPEKKPDGKTYVEKAKKDFAKALVLRGEKGYVVEKWCFVTPADLREEVQREIREMAKAKDLIAICIGETHLRDLFLKHPHLNDLFPELAAPQVAKELADLKRLVSSLLEGGVQNQAPKAEGPQAPQALAFGLDMSKDLADAQETMLAGDLAGAVAKLEKIRQTSKDDRERVWAISLLVQCERNSEPLDKLEAIAREGVVLAERLGEIQPLAVCKAELGVVLCRRYFELASQAFFAIQTARVIGILTISAEDIRTYQGLAADAYKEAMACFKDGYERTSANGLLRGSTIVLFRFASGLLTVFMTDKMSGADMHPAKVRLRGIYDNILKSSNLLQDTGLVSAAHLNYAVCLRTIEDMDSAQKEAEEALRLAEAGGFPGDLRKAKELLARIKEERGDPGKA
jgi:tetratricopeptide (TPR) repeat protein